MADRILVVEDEEAISELIEMNLTVAGYEVVQVYDGGKGRRGSGTGSRL